jgi:hypothetical protein
MQLSAEIRWFWPKAIQNSFDAEEAPHGQGPDASATVQEGQSHTVLCGHDGGRRQEKSVSRNPAAAGEVLKVRVAELVE